MITNDSPSRSIPARRFAVSVVGAGPAGLFAAESLAGQGFAVTIYDRMPSPARKFLMAGRGGLNLTHSEDLAKFISRYHDPEGVIRKAVTAFPPAALIDWANGLGAETFVGSSGRVFPRAMKASPLLRAWLKRLGDLGVVLRTGWTWRDFGDAPTTLLFDTAEGVKAVKADAVLLAPGGASWPRLGSNGAWVATLRNAGVEVTNLSPSNCGVTVPWSSHIARHAGAPLKRISVTCGDSSRRGEAVITTNGLEGGVIYALSGALREQLGSGHGTITIDLRPEASAEELTARMERVPAKESLSNALRKGAALSPAAAAVLREAGPLTRDPVEVARRLKNVCLPITGLSGLERAISTVGGVRAASANEGFMLKPLPGVFVAGEMLDFDAPTGGYLLQAAFATGLAAACGITQWLKSHPR